MSAKRKHSRQKIIIRAAIIGILAITSVVGASQITQIREFFSRASGRPANLVIDVTATAPFPTKPWQNLGQGGESVSFSLKPIAGEIKQLSPRHIRIDHLYDFYVNVSRGSDGKFQYDFSKLDTIISEIRSVNALPFLSLSYMPTALNGDITGPPTNWDEYYLVVKATIEHVSGRSGLNIKDAYYEVWNEPDLFGQWRTYGDRNYLTLYKTASNAAKAAANTQPFHFGGPATTGLYENWIIAFMDTVIKQNLRMDFISWHRYSDDPEVYGKDIDLLRQFMTPYQSVAKNTEIIISEWGINSENDARYDGNAAAAHLVTSLTYMIPAVDRAFVFEIEDGKNQEGKEYWGRWGLFTHVDFGSHAKPRVQAIKLLNRLGSEQLHVSGNGTWVRALATRKNNTVQVIAANYDPRGRHTEDVPFSLNGLPPGQYRLETTIMGRAKTSKSILVNGPVYTTTLSFPPNAVMLVEIMPE